MIDGTYIIKVNSPFGIKEGTVTLRTEGDVLFADIDAPIVGKQHLEGVAQGDTFTAQGSGKIMLVGKIDFAIKGEVSGNDLHIDIDSSKGQFSLNGVRA